MKFHTSAAFLALILLAGYQAILTRLSFHHDVAMAQQITELTNQLVRFDVNSEP